MQWIHRYQLFLFDFDGLLVNTEDLHFQAYIHMCAQRGFHLNWDFHQFSAAAHHSATGLRDQIYAEFPDLYAQEPVWQVLYAEKKQAFLDLVQKGHAQLMPGVKELLFNLTQAQIRSCVVTHSPLAVIQLIREQNPLLNAIPHWITREDYSQPKPHAECYELAIQRFALSGDRVIGFEDSPRGFKALQQTSALPVLICPLNSPYLNSFLHPALNYYPAFDQITDSNAPG